MSIMQNESVKHGSNVYMRAVTQATPRPEVVTATFQKMVELTPPEKEHRLAAVFEYFVLRKVATVPHDAMAFNNRGTHQNVLGTSMWLDNTPSNQAIGREKCYAMTDVIACFQNDVDSSKSRSYGNYGNEIISIIILPITHLVHNLLLQWVTK